MQTKKLWMLALCSGLAMAGCKTTGTDLGGMIGAGTSMATAASLSDEDAAAMGKRTAEAMDKEYKVASSNSKYGKRVATLTAKFVEVDGRKLDYKVYLTSDVNAYAMPNGSIRIYSGLLDQMNDDEVLYVIGHEIGHVVLGHTKSKMQMAYAASAARQAAAASGNSAVANLSASELGALGEKFVNAQYSQKNENEADAYAFDLLKKRGKSTLGTVSALRKLEALYGNSGGVFSSHPNPGERAKKMEQLASR